MVTFYSVAFVTVSFLGHFYLFVFVIGPKIGENGRVKVVHGIVYLYKICSELVYLKRP